MDESESGWQWAKVFGVFLTSMKGIQEVSKWLQFCQPNSDNSASGIARCQIEKDYGKIVGHTVSFNCQ